jgi:hypothetical protein
MNPIPPYSTKVRVMTQLGHSMSALTYSSAMNKVAMFKMGHSITVDTLWNMSVDVIHGIELIMLWGIIINVYQ